MAYEGSRVNEYVWGVLHCSSVTAFKAYCLASRQRISSLTSRCIFGKGVPSTVDSHFKVWPKRMPRSLPETSVYHNLVVSASHYPEKTAIVYY